MSASVQVRKGELAAIIEKEHQVTASEGSEIIKPDAKHCEHREHYDGLISDRDTARNRASGASAAQADIDVTDE